MKQRPGPSRRDVLAGAAAGIGSALAGCAGRAGGSTRSSPAPGTTDAASSGPVTILAAGSLRSALSRGLARAVDVPLRIEARGSTAAARLVAGGGRDPDIVSLADTRLFDAVLDSSWYAAFASNAVVVAYNPDTEGGRRVAEAGRDGWYAPLLDGTASLGRTDPDRDPLGYRALFALELASRYYGVSGLRDRIPARRQVYPETSLLSRLETGAIDAAIVYRNMAVERGYDYFELPDEIDLSAPEHAEDWYSAASYTLPGGTTVRGGVISYGSTVRRPGPAAVDVFEAQVSGGYLADHGFLLPDGFPRYEGDVPDAIGG